MDKLPENFDRDKARKAAFGIGVGLLVILMVTPFAADKILVEKESFTLPANATVVNPENVSVGVAAGTENALDFGRLIVNATNSTRYVNVSTPGSNIATLKASGNISSYLDYPRYVRNASSIPVEMQAIKVGNFTGNLTVRVQIPKKELGEKWLRIKHSLYS
ncbi:MAG: hypothetical protein ABEK00_03190 [Candidatus Nanohaloarchaea archaeon]